MWLCASGLLAQAQPEAQSAGSLAPLESLTTAAYRAPTAQETALLQQLMAEVQREGSADTELLPLVGQALRSANPHVRVNAFAMLQVAMMTLRSTPGERSTIGTNLDRALVEQALADRSPIVKAARFSELWSWQSPDFLTVVVAKLNDESDPLARVTATAALLNVVPTDPSVVERVTARLAVETDLTCASVLPARWRACVNGGPVEEETCRHQLAASR